MTAPFGRRACEVTESRASGGYTVRLLWRLRRPSPKNYKQLRMLAA